MHYRYRDSTVQSVPSPRYYREILPIPTVITAVLPHSPLPCHSLVYTTDLCGVVWAGDGTGSLRQAAPPGLSPSAARSPSSAHSAVSSHRRRHRPVTRRARSHRRRHGRAGRGRRAVPGRGRTATTAMTTRRTWAGAEASRPRADHHRDAVGDHKAASCCIG